MNFLSGSPLYNYELALELRRLGHKVTLMSVWEPVLGDARPLRTNLESAGVECLTTLDKQPQADLVISSQRSMKRTGLLLNVVHSEYDCEAPDMDADGFIAIRPSIKEHLETLGLTNIAMIYNGIDSNRFNPSLRLGYVPKEYRTTLVPCTFDGLRETFIRTMAAQSSPEHKIIFMGYNHGLVMPYGDNIEVVGDRFDIEQVIAKVDNVAGILLGRVNLEAAFMNVGSDIYNPETGLKTSHFLGGYQAQYDIKCTTREILNFANQLS